MIMAQERAFIKAQSQLETMIAWIRESGPKEGRIDQVERRLFADLLQLGLTLLKGFIAQQGDGDEGETLEHQGRILQRLPRPHKRRYLSIFGELWIRRWVYGQREGQKMEALPLDARLGLPANDFSHVLEDWLQRLCLKESFAEAVTSLQTLLGLSVSVRSAEEMNRRMAEDAESYRESQPPPPPAEEGEILVATADGKGVPMRRPLEERVRRGPRRGKGEKANKKQMAYVGAVYSIAPFVRTAEDVVDELARRQAAPERPVPQHKRLWAEMTCVREGETCNGKASLFEEMSSEATARNSPESKPVVCLMDGETGLWSMQRQWFSQAVGVLDLFHVLERLWDAAYCFHTEKSPQAAEFVEHRLRMILQGKVGYVIGDLRRRLRKRGLKPAVKKTLSATIRYYDHNRQHMRYDEYLAAGYPIGSGVAEGACRHLVKDRMEQTGMRWTVDGAHAMLHLRSIYLNKTWDHFREYRIQKEQHALYGQNAA
jgi:hypothetical protein